MAVSYTHLDVYKRQVIGYEATPVKQVVAIAEIVKAADGQKIYFKKTESLLPKVHKRSFLKIIDGSLRLRDVVRINDSEKFIKIKNLKTKFPVHS